MSERDLVDELKANIQDLQSEKGGNRPKTIEKQRTQNQTDIDQT